MIFPADEILSFIDAKMSRQRIVIVPTDELYLNDFWYKH